MHRIEDRETAQNMTSVAKVISKQTTYKKSEEEENESSSGNANRSDDMHPNSVNLLLFNDNKERLIDGN